MRKRVEDLGRLLVMLQNIRNHEIFEIVPGRNKDFSDDFYVYDQNEQRDMLHKFAYGLETVAAEIWECIEIARGEDELNLSDDQQ